MNTTISTLIISETLYLPFKTPIIIRQAPVKSSPPNNTIITKPIGNTKPATSLAIPVFEISCIATLLAIAPAPISIPARIPNKIILCSGRFTLPSPASMRFCVTSAVVFEKFINTFLSYSC